MRKCASILMAIMVLLTGIHLSIASHLCQGRLVAVKVSITSENAPSCGMEGNTSTFPLVKISKKHCCENDLTTLSVDSNYSPSFAKNIEVPQKNIQISGVPFTEIVKELAFTHAPNPILSPPGIFRTNTVELASICVFRI